MPKKITKITSQKKPGRFNIFLDDAYAFAVSEDVLIKFRLAKGQILTEDELALITQQENIAKAYHKTLNYLSYKLRSEEEVAQYLTGMDVLATDQKAIMEKLRSLNLLDDLVYAKSYVRTQMRLTKKGPNDLKMKLRKLGIGENLIEEALREYPHELRLENGLQLAKKYANKYRHEAERVKMQKIKVNLVKNGYPNDGITFILQALAKEQPTDEAKQDLAFTFQAEKLLRRYHTLSDFKTKQKFRQALYRKGFSLNQIDEFILEHEDA